MNRTNLLKKLHHLKRRYGLPLFVAATVVSVSWITMDHANALYILTGAEDSAIILDDASSQVREISSQLVYLSSGQEGYDLTLTSKQTVVVRHNGEVLTTQARSETVSKLLSRLHITPGPLEMVAVDVTNGSNVVIICEKLPLEAMTEEQYIEALRAQMAQTTVEADLGEPEPAALGGVDFTALNYTVASNGVETGQTMLVHKQGGRMYAIAISYQLPEQRDAILEAFSALPAEV